MNANNGFCCKPFGWIFVKGIAESVQEALVQGFLGSWRKRIVNGGKITLGIGAPDIHDRTFNTPVERIRQHVKDK